MATAISFGFASASTYGRRLDLTARLDIRSINGFAILTNGMDPNQKIETGTGMTDLIPRAPREEVYPGATGAPSSTGKIYGDSYKWRIRYRNSKTGETTGLSPLPFMGYNLGRETFASSGVWLGQTAYFVFAGFAYAALGDDRVGMDTIDLCRNTSAQTKQFYVVQSKANPGAGVNVYFTDNIPDEEVWDLVQTDLVVNPTYYTPLPPPCVRSHLHSTQRLMLYGRINMGPKRSGADFATLALDDTAVATTNGFWFRGREGQLFNFVTDTTKTSYRVIEVTDPNALYVNQKSPATMSATWELLDDIDSRAIYMMRPNQPWSHDPRDVFYVGADLADGVMGISAIDGKTFVLTRHNLWRLEDDFSEEPRETVRIVHVANVGCVGHWAWCSTPYGIVFVDENKGVMTYTGEGLPEPLGSSGPLDDFKPKTQFDRFDRGYLSETYCEWDPTAQRVFVSYCPTGVAALIEQLSFDPVPGNWRGPWRRPVYRGGKLIDQTGKDVFLLGDMLGTLMLEGDITTDLATVTTGTVLTYDNPVQITTTTSAFAGNAVGASILFHDGAGNYYLNWIARRISGTKVALLLVPEATIGVGWTFAIGTIHWQAKTAFVDLGDAGQPKVIRKVELGYERVGTVDNVVLDAVSEGVTITEAADTAALTVTGGLIKSSMDINVGGTAFTLRFSGRASNGQPRLTKVRADMTINEGEEVPTTGDRKKVVITPTATS